MIRAALAFAKKGMAVFPCRPRDKRPATANGLKDATTSADAIQAWWQHSPDYNIGVATGAVSGIFVVDIDGVDAEAELRKLEAEHGALPASVEAITARGRHVYFKWPDQPVRNSASKIAPGVDTRGVGGYVLAPPSVHPSGRRYEWSVDCADHFAEAPSWLLGKITAPVRGSNGVRGTPPSEWRELVKGVSEGGRDCSATRLAGYLLRRRVDPIVALELMQTWNAARCTPPLPAEDIERIVGSVCGRELKRRGADG
jgi:Bifunctional DNA primase/polymerase, N-terminal/Primase C terminal 1 (PriCT-1)